MAERNVTFLILAKDFASRVMKNVGDSTDRTAQKLRNMNVLGIGPLATAAAALGPALLPVLGAAAIGTVGLGIAFVSAGAAAGVFGAVTATTFKEVAEASKKSDDLRTKISLLNREISMAPKSQVDTLVKSRNKAILEYKARLAELPAPTRAAVMALDSLKTAWENFVEKAKPTTLPLLTRGFALLASVIPKLQPLFAVAAQYAGYLMTTLERFVSGGKLDQVINFLASRAGPVFEKFGGILISLAAGVGYLLAPFVKTSDGVIDGLDRMSLAFAGWARGSGAQGVQRIIGYVTANGPRMTALFIGIATSLASLAQAAAPLAPVSLAIATSLTQIINAMPQGVLTALIAGFIAWSVAIRAAMIITALASAAGGIIGVFVGLTAAITGTTLATEANTAAKVAYSIATGIATVATAIWGAALWVAAAAMAVLTSPIFLIVAGIALLVAGFILAYKHITPFREAVDAVGRAFVAAGQWIAGVFMSAIRAIPGILNAIPGFFAALPGRILQALIFLPTMYIKFWKFVLEQGAYWVGYGIGKTARFFMDLPGRVMRAINALPGLLSRLWQSIWNTGVSLAVGGSKRIVSFFASLPGRAMSAIRSIGGQLAGIFRNAWNSAVSIVVNGVNRAVGFFRTLPGRARSAVQGLPGQIKGAFAGAAGWLVSAGMDIIRGLISGIGRMAGAAVGEAKRIAGNIVSGVMSGLGIGSPSKVMADKVGVWIPPGIAQGMLKAMPGLLGTVRGAMGSVTDAAVASGTGAVDFSTNARPGFAGAALPGGIGSGGVTVVVNIDGALDPVAVGRQLVSVLDRWAKTQGKTFELAK